MKEYNNFSRFIEDLIDLKENDVLSQARDFLESGNDAFKLVDAAQEAMHQVGELYAEGKYYISSMMMAGEIFREVLELAEPDMTRGLGGDESGHVLLGTVLGDIHDIGKNIFSMLLKAYGFTVTDLGVDISPDVFAAAAQELNPDIIGLSGIITLSYDAMKETILRIKKLESVIGRKIPCIVGGATINEMVCSHVGSDYWSRDAMVGLNLCRQIMREKRNDTARGNGE